MGGNSSAIKKIGHQYVKQTKILITSMTTPTYLIQGTIPVEEEELVVNEFIKQGKYSTSITVYGMNSNDDTAMHKCEKLKGFGFTNIQLYTGGLFEWLLLGDIYGETNFPLHIPLQMDINLLQFATN